MTLKECMKKKKPYMVHEEAIGGVDGCPSSQPFLHCEKGLCEQDDKGRGSTWTSLCSIKACKQERTERNLNPEEFKAALYGWRME